MNKVLNHPVKLIEVNEEFKHALNDLNFMVDALLNHHFSSKPFNSSKSDILARKSF